MSRYYNDYLQHSDEDILAHFGIPGMKWGAEKQMKKKYGKEYIKQRDARERKKIILGLATTAGLAAYTNYKLKHYPIYSNTKKF